MYSTKPIINFSGGEASPLLKARVDAKQYYALAETLENVIVNQYGGAFRTSGTKYTHRVKNVNKKARLIPFIFSQGDAYQIEFGDKYIRFHQNNGSVVESAKNITDITKADPCVVTVTAHGYSDGDVIDIEDVGGMTELNGKRYKVNNVTANTFELQDEDGNDIDSTSYSTYTSGGTTERVYEISSPYAESDLRNIKYTQQGDIVYLTCSGYEQRQLKRFGSTNWTLSTPVYDEFSWPAFKDINTTSTTITPSATTGTGITLTASADLFNSDHVGSYWKLDISGTIGYVKVTAYTDAKNVTANVISDLGGTTATEDWYEGAWSDDEGWPVDVTFYEQRLYYFKDLNIWGSEEGSYDNFDNGTDSDPTEDTDPVKYKIGANQVDSILWAYPANILLAGTGAGPFVISSGSATSPITPTSISVKPQNEAGAGSISPVRIGPFVYYVESSGTRIGQFTYNLNYDIYDTEDITYLNSHILGDGVVEMALQKYPYNILWCVLEDGTMATMTREISNNIKGWTRQVFSGTDVEIESVSVIPNGKEDQVWIIVKRTIDGKTMRYIEYFMPFEINNQEDVFFVQSGLTYDGTSTDTVSGLDHLEGETVAVLVDGAVHPDKTVNNGSITLDWEGEKIHVGLGYTSTIKTMDIEAGANAGTAQGKVMSISKVVVRFYKSLGCKLGDGITMDSIPFRDWGDNFSEAPDLFTGDKEVEFPSGHRKNKYIEIQQEQPLPMHILGLFPTLVTYG